MKQSTAKSSNVYLRLLRLAFLISIIGCIGCKNNQVAIEKSYKLIPVKLKKDGKISLMDMDGKVILEDEFSAQSSIFYSEGIVREQTKDDFVKYHQIDGDKSNLITEEKFTEGTPFVNGYAVVRKEDGMLALLNKDGSYEIENLSKIESYNVLRAGIVSEELIRFKTDEGLWGYCNTKGKVKIKPEYAACENFYDGLARVIDEDGQVKIINTSGSVTFKGKEDFSYLPAGNNLIGFKEHTNNGDDFYGFMDLNGEKKIKDNKYKLIGGSGYFNNGLMVVRGDESDSWGVINETGEIAGELKTKFEIQPIIAHFGEVFVNFEKDKKCKIFSNKGELKKEIDDYLYVIPYNKERYLAFDKNEKFYLIDNDGKEVSKDPFYINSTRFNLISAITQNREFNNSLSVMSTYFEIEPLFKKVFMEVSLNGMCGMNQNSNIGQVIKAFPNVSSDQTTERKRSVDKSDDYQLEMYSKGKKTNIEVTEETDLTEVAPVETPTTDTVSSAIETTAYPATTYYTPIPDDYPYLSQYSSIYNPASINIAEGSYSMSFSFDENLKQEEVSTNEYGYPSITGYGLNNNAQLQTITCNLYLDGIDYKIFEKQMSSKLNANGWKKDNNGLYRNGSNQNTISINGTSVVFRYPTTAPY